MNAVLLPLPLGEGRGKGQPRVEEPSARYLVNLQPPLVRSFDLLATAPQGVAKLRALVLSLAMQGKLVKQEPADSPVAELLKNIQREKDRLRKEGLIRQGTSHTQVTVDALRPLPSGWRYVKAQDICSVVTDGDHLPPPRSDAGIPFLVIGNVRDGHIDIGSASRKVPRQYFEKLDWSKKPTPGDVLYTTVGSFGIPAPVLSSEEFCFQRHIALFRPAVVELQRYLLLALKSSVVFDQASQGATGIAQKTVSLAVLRNLVIPLPPLAEQARIVARVEELMKLCDALEERGRLEAEQHARLVSTLFDALAASENTQALADNWQGIAQHFDLLLDRPEAIDALEQTILQLAVRGRLVPQDRLDESGLGLLNRIQRSRTIRRKIVMPSEDAVDSLESRLPSSWTCASMDQISADDESAIADGPFGANLKTEHYIERPGYRVIRLQNIGHGEFRDEHRAYVDKTRFEALVKHQVRAGDLVVAGLIDRSIRCCAVPEGIGPAIVKADCYRFSVHPFISSQYVLHYLNSVTAHEFAAVHHHGLTLTRIGLGNFRSIPIPLPPLAEQHRIVARVNELRTLCTQLRERLQQARRTQGLLAEALVQQAAGAGE